jgi:hypothetical protein
MLYIYIGDLDIRLGPTLISAFKTTKAIAVSCGDRHSLVVTSHRPIKIIDDIKLKPYFKILNVKTYLFIRFF